MLLTNFLENGQKESMISYLFTEEGHLKGISLNGTLSYFTWTSFFMNFAVNMDLKWNVQQWKKIVYQVGLFANFGRTTKSIIHEKTILPYL